MLISINEDDARPIYQQIIAQVKEQVRTGALEPSDLLPSVRELARSLEINLHTVRNAYQRLGEQGVIRVRLGQRARVAEPPTSPANRAEAEARLTQRLRDLATEAYHLGVSREELLGLIDDALGESGGG